MFTDNHGRRHLEGNAMQHHFSLVLHEGVDVITCDPDLEASLEARELTRQNTSGMHPGHPLVKTTARFHRTTAMSCFVAP